MKVNVLMIDPPEGWRYGFPKPYNCNLTLDDQLIQAGYPKEDLEFISKYTRWYFLEKEQ